MTANSNNLKELSVAHCGLLDNFGFPFAEGLKVNKGLVRVNFSNNEFTSTTLVAIAQAIEMNPAESLKEMNFARNKLDDKGGVALGESLRENTSIARINLSDNNLTDATAIAFNTSLQTNKSLVEVNFQRNLVNLRHLEVLWAHCAKNLDV